MSKNRITELLAFLCLTTAIASRAQTLTTLHSFKWTDGVRTFAGLVQATSGDLYGTTSEGGANGNFGTVFKITPNGKLTALYSFCSRTDCRDGFHPSAELIQATDGSFYGTTSPHTGLVGSSVFRITTSGKLKTLYRFCLQSGCPDGVTPYAGLIQATDGNLYGTTYEGGKANLGTIFKITTGGVLTKLYDFAGGDGARPDERLVQAVNGNLFGTTAGGGSNGDFGTVFKVTPSGKLTTLYSFGGRDGATPFGGLIQAIDGNFYGTTLNGGAHGVGTVFKISPTPVKLPTVKVGSRELGSRSRQST